MSGPHAWLDEQRRYSLHGLLKLFGPPIHIEHDSFRSSEKIPYPVEGRSAHGSSYGRHARFPCRTVNAIDGFAPFQSFEGGFEQSSDRRLYFGVAVLCDKG